MSALGGRLDEPMLTDQIDDEYDVLNDETFGGEIPHDEWESEHVGDELDAAVAAAAEAERSLLEFAAARLPITEDPLDFLEQSISHLVDDDDVAPFNRGQKASIISKPLTDIFAPGSPQNPFFQLDRSSIWSDSVPLPKKSSQVADPAVAVSSLFESMRINGNESTGLSPAGPPVLVKGAKTAEELEAELLGKTTSTPPPQPKPAGPVIKSCQELEKELIESSRNAAAASASGVVRPPSDNSTVRSEGQAIPEMPPGVGFPQQAPNILMRLPPPHHPMMANPQMRAALIARWMATNQGAQAGVPPGLFRIPPPPMMPPPGAGYRPPITIRPGHMPPMNFNNARMPQNIDPRAIGFMLQHGGIRRPPPNFPKRRLFDSPVRHGGGNGRYDNDRRDRDRDHYQHNRDPFAGLMTRRERSWLIKIQAIQLLSENPYVDDYYWLMYRRRKMANDGTVYKDSDQNDNLEHRAYIPPSFEGSLGKVQVLSANFPRQVLDLAASSAENGELKQQQSVEEGSPRDSPSAVSKTGQAAPGKRLKNILIELENLYLMLLEANDLTMVHEHVAAVQLSKEKAAARAKNLVQSVVSALIFEDRIATALAIRKGRRLLMQLLVHCNKDDCMRILQAILTNLGSLCKKEPHLEILAAIRFVLESKLTGLNETDWSLLWETVNIDVVENALKYKTGSGLFILLIQRSAAEKIQLSKGACKIAERWASIIYSNIANSGNKDGLYRTGALGKPQVEQLSSWLRNTSGAQIPSTVIDTIESWLAPEPTP